MTMIRVSDTITGAQYTIPDVTLDAERHERIDAPAVDADGRPLPPQYPAPSSVETPHEGPSIEPVVDGEKETNHG